MCRPMKTNGRKEHLNSVCLFTVLHYKISPPQQNQIVYYQNHLMPIHKGWTLNIAMDQTALGRPIFYYLSCWGCHAPINFKLTLNTQYTMNTFVFHSYNVLHLRYSRQTQSGHCQVINLLPALTLIKYVIKVKLKCSIQTFFKCISSPIAMGFEQLGNVNVCYSQIVNVMGKRFLIPPTKATIIKSLTVLMTRYQDLPS